MKKLVMLGIDGMDSEMLARFNSEMPNFKRLRETGLPLGLESVQPPDSNTAWASIHTGLNPARHGIVHFVDPLERVGIISTNDIDNSTLRGRTYWDIAGQAGKRVCIIFPHLTYPGWGVNGVMVSRSAVRDEMRTYPQSIADEYDLSHLYNMPGFPKGKKFLMDYAELARNLVRGEAKLGLKMMHSSSWDIFFLYSAALDTIQHFFWMYHDPEDPTYPGDNPFQNVIRDFYKLHDEIVGEFLDNVDSDTAVMVFSDHGHGMRPVRLLNINEWLRQKGFLVSRQKGGGISPISLVEKSKRMALDFIIKHELGNLALKLIVWFSWARRWYSTASSLDWDKTLAFLPDFSGIKAYSYGGIKIKKENLRSISYEELRSQIIQGFSDMEEPESRQRLMRWICRREELYSGEYLVNYPDIVFHLIDEYGAGGGIHDSILSKSLSHSLVPGSHRAYSGVFFLANINGMPLRQKINVMDIAPTVLDILDIKGDFDFDGKSAFK